MDKYDIKHLITAPKVHSEFCFLEISEFSKAKKRETLRSEKTKLTVSQGTSFKVICYMAGNFEAENSLDITVMVVVGQHSQVTVHCYPPMS